MGSAGKKFIAVVTMGLTLSLGAEQGCRLPEFGAEVTESHPLCLFYSGTEHFRNERMTEAVDSWAALAASRDVTSEYEELQVSALNNLGYMYFFGLGIPEDKNRALEYWRRAVSLGHSESEYHLCHAYGEANGSTYNTHRARRHCRKAEAIYEAIEGPDEDERTILDTIRMYRSIVEAEDA